MMLCRVLVLLMFHGAFTGPSLTGAHVAIHQLRQVHHKAPVGTCTAFPGHHLISGMQSMCLSPGSSGSVLWCLAALIRLLPVAVVDGFPDGPLQLL